MKPTVRVTVLAVWRISAPKFISKCPLADTYLKTEYRYHRRTQPMQIGQRIMFKLTVCLFKVPYDNFFPNDLRRSLSF